MDGCGWGGQAAGARECHDMRKRARPAPTTGSPTPKLMDGLDVTMYGSQPAKPSLARSLGVDGRSCNQARPSRTEQACPSIGPPSLSFVVCPPFPARRLYGIPPSLHNMFDLHVVGYGDGGTYMYTYLRVLPSSITYYTRYLR